MLVVLALKNLLVGLHFQSPFTLPGLRLSICVVENKLWTTQENEDTEMDREFDAAQLNHFTGTEHYYRISRRHLLTDGTKYLVEMAGAFWMMDAIASHLSEIGTGDWFVVVKVKVQDSKATMLYEDGNGNEHARQDIPYTDFPMNEISIYACWDGQHWVLMLPSEY